MKGKVLRRLARFLRPYGAWLAILLVLLVASNLLSLAAPMLSGWAVDAIGTQPGQADFRRVLGCCAAMLACYAVSALLNYAIAARLIRVGQAVSHDLRKAAFDRMS